MTPEKQHEINIFIKGYKTCDLLLAPFHIFSVNFCNNTTQKLCQYTPYIMKYQGTTWLASDIHLNQSYLSIIRQIQKAVLTTTGGHHDCLFKAATSQNLPQHCPTHFSSIPIGCHVPPTNFSACSLVLKFSNSLYIHCDYLLFHFFAFINHTWFSMTKNLSVYQLNTAQFCCK